MTATLDGHALPTGMCRSCRALVVWVESITTGKRLPMDAHPTTDGTLVIEGRTLTGAVAVRVLRASETTTRDRFTSHFATCPEADDWRRK